MAQTTKKSFPMLPLAHWWALRQKFKQSIPGVVTDSYLATVLEMAANSARANVLPFLKVLGIIDEDGKPKERAKLWRDDDQYPEVCAAIVKEVYPQELVDAVPEPSKNRDKAKRWFANHTGAGEGACKRMVSLYAVLVEGDPTKSDTAAAEQGTKTSSAPTSPKKARTAPAKVAREAPSPPKAAASADNSVPSININLQIHISADASTDQIEEMFAAMAKHIYKRG
jgi:hypothetical protein